MNQQEQPVVLPHFKIVVLDETSDWDSVITEKSGRIYQAYLFDSSRHHHCCEITPSYELYPLYSTPQNDDSEGSISEKLMTNESSDVIYIHVHRLDKLSPAHFHSFGLESEYPESWETLRDSYIEYARGNHVLEIPAGVPMSYEPAAA